MLVEKYETTPFPTEGASANGFVPGWDDILTASLSVEPRLIQPKSSFKSTGLRNGPEMELTYV